MTTTQQTGRGQRSISRQQSDELVTIIGDRSRGFVDTLDDIIASADPGSAIAAFELQMRLYLGQDQFPEVMRAFEEILERFGRPEQAYRRAQLILSYARMVAAHGQQSDAERIMTLLDEATETFYVNGYHIYGHEAEKLRWTLDPKDRGRRISR